MFQKLDHLHPDVKTLACSWVCLIRFSPIDWTSEVRLMLSNSSKSADNSPPVHVRTATSQVSEIVCSAENTN